MIMDWKKFADEVHEFSLSCGTWAFSKEDENFDEEKLYDLMVELDSFDENNDDEAAKVLVGECVQLLDMAAEWKLPFQYMFAPGNNFMEDIRYRNMEWLTGMLSSLIEGMVMDLELPSSVGFDALDVDICRFIEIVCTWLRIRKKNPDTMMRDALERAKRTIPHNKKAQGGE